MDLLRHRGVDRSRRDCVDADPDIAQLRGLLLRQVDQCRLAGSVRDAQRARAQSRDRCDVDDAAAAVAQHHARGGLRAQECAAEVDVEHARPFVVRRLEDRLEYGDAGVVDERVDATEARDDRIECACNLRGNRDVAFERDRAVVVIESGDGFARCRKRCGIDVEQRDAMAGRQELARDGQADAARGSGDDGNRSTVHCFARPTAEAVSGTRVGIGRRT